MRFWPKDPVLWMHPLGFAYRCRIVSMGRGKQSAEDWAVISLDEKALMFVLQKELVAVAGVAERNNKMGEEIRSDQHGQR
jgi:hypothetical protein